METGNKRAIDIQRDIKEMKLSVEYRKKGLFKRIKELSQKQLEIEKLEAQIAEQETALKKLMEE